MIFFLEKNFSTLVLCFPAKKLRLVLNLEKLENVKSVVRKNSSTSPKGIDTEKRKRKKMAAGWQPSVLLITFLFHVLVSNSQTARIFYSERTTLHFYATSFIIKKSTAEIYDGLESKFDLSSENMLQNFELFE